MFIKISFLTFITLFNLDPAKLLVCRISHVKLSREKGRFFLVMSTRYIPSLSLSFLYYLFNKESTGVFEKDVWIINVLQWVILYHFVS